MMKFQLRSCRLHPVVIPLFASFKSRSSCDVVLYCQHCINDSSHNHSRIKLSIPCVVNEKGNISLLLGQELVLDLLVSPPPYLAPFTIGPIVLKGVNYASGGGGIFVTIMISKLIVQLTIIFLSIIIL
ncbi:hypothetical protein JHK82_039979 [Glycine max]|uniref:Uncharacterized protein n=2 Tax=Glycine subgen. Soja TaxID=1462606 RepID=K7M714_SOYBN|nr:hypothetical protein JHK86_040175 [Glycine max]RZB69072.1 hypothetical protein D0Y65_038728 [Glycine soja]KAG4965784.1 hypothetical protein JHK85_040759 [Glycine max]KAG5110756.1 hypothetical protein JHK82_039979 [Glycine max]KAG5122053.1 hypothetical protein JHK84_040393 [Glycine max]